MTFGITFNSIYSVDKGIIITNIKRSLMPPAKNRNISVPLRPGGYFVRTDFGERKFTVDVVYPGTSSQDVASKERDLASWLWVTQPAALVFDDEPNKTYYAVIDGNTDFSQIAYLGKGTLTFKCFDPFSYGTETSQAFASDSSSPNVSGTYQTYPRIEATLSAAASNFKVLHVPSGKYVNISRTFASGDTVTIDCSKSLIQVNGNRDLIDLDIASEFFALTPGSQTLNITPTGVSSATIYWTPRWL